MNLIPVLAFLGGLLFPGMLYLTERNEKRTAALIVKTISSITFVLLGFICGKNSVLPDFVRLFVLGEICGAVGDVIINLGPWFKGSPVPLCLGGGCFLIGHGFFVAAFCKINPSGILLSVFLTVILFLLVFSLLLKFTETDRVMRLLTSVYMLFVTATFAFSLSAFLSSVSFERFSLVFGTLLFLFADFDLMLQTMGKKKWKFVFPCMYTYYPAQIIIALCLYWFR